MKLKYSTFFKLPLVVVVLGLIIFATPSYANRFDKATELFNKQEYKKASALWEKAGSSAKENGASYYRIAELYRDGLGHKQHYGRAADWYRQSAEKGYVPAMYELGLLHHRAGDETVKNINAAILWWEKAALMGDAGSQMELAQLYFSPINKDISLALKFARAAGAQNYPASFLLLRNIDAQIETLGIKGTSQLQSIQGSRYTLALASFKDFNSAWNFVIKSEIKNAGIHQSVYNEYDVTVGNYGDVDAAYAAIVSLRKDLLALRPRPRRMEVIHRELMPMVENLPETWVKQSNSESYTVELYRANSPIDAQGLINQHGLTNSATYKSVYADTVVVAGVFESFQDANQVRQALPQELVVLQPRVVKFAEVKAELMDKSVSMAYIETGAKTTPVIAKSRSAETSSITSNTKAEKVELKPAKGEPKLVAKSSIQNIAAASLPELFKKSNNWLANAANDAYTLQVATINDSSGIDKLLSKLKQQYPEQPVHVFDQLVPKYYYFYVGLFESWLEANEAVRELNAKGAIIRKISGSKVRRCADRVKAKSNSENNLSYCN